MEHLKKYRNDNRLVIVDSTLSEDRIYSFIQFVMNMYNINKARKTANKVKNGEYVIFNETNFGSRIYWRTASARTGKMILKGE
jgi:hypothetical protein